MKIEVCGVPYTVTFVDGWKQVSHDPDNAPRHAGEIHWVTNDIRIDKSRDKAVVDVTVWHEIIHAIIETMKIRELFGTDDEQLEAPVDQLAVGIASVLKDLGISIAEEIKRVR